jgi:Protein of unknown function (DUF2721)
MADTATLAQNPFALLSLIAAPAVLTNSASVLALSTSNRFLRASERLRAVAARYDEALSPDLRALIIRQLSRIERQATKLRNGLRAAYVAIGSFVSASLISILGAGVAASSSSFHDVFQVFALLALSVGVVGACGMVWASVNLLGATHLAMLNMNDDAELIYARERARVAKA